MYYKKNNDYCNIGTKSCSLDDIFEQNDFIIGSGYNGSSVLEQTKFNNSIDFNVKISNSCKSFKSSKLPTQQYLFSSNFMDFTESIRKINFAKPDPILTQKYKINPYSISDYKLEMSCERTC